jgi:hypothetical protein
MTIQGGALNVFPCLDFVEMSPARRRELDIPRSVAAALGRSAVEAAGNGHYFNGAGEKVDWSFLVNAVERGRRVAPANCLIYRCKVDIKGVVWPQRKPFQSFNRFASFKSFKLLSEWIRLFLP